MIGDSMNAKEVRLNRITNNGKMFCVPLDHGMTMGTIGKLTDIKHTVHDIACNGASSIIIHKGMLRFIAHLPSDVGIIIHLSASTNMSCPVKKILVCEVEEALSLGADAVSIHVNLANSFEKDMLADFARISKECMKFGVPLLVMVYLRDDANKDVSTPESFLHAIRICTELGADIVKVSYNPAWGISTLQKAVAASTVPLIIAGGEVDSSQSSFYEWTKKIVATGAFGICYGRNVFMSTDIAATVTTLAKIVYDN